VALVGSSGCGKSSIIALVQRFYDPVKGEVFFSGKNVKDLDPKWYKTQISIVQQEPVLFPGTIRENIQYGTSKVFKEEEIEEACRQACALGFIQDKSMFPEGFDTVVGERGVKLSGGQKQRVAIARALIRKPKILLLDEATSALDAESEFQVQQALDELIKNGKQTIIVIAHRLSTIRDANTIVVMENGVIAEMGNHHELVEKNGAYMKLIQRQLESDDHEDLHDD
jgi:ABC-type multidrug transport system fused ATPase/permease subunit